MQLLATLLLTVGVVAGTAGVRRWTLVSPELDPRPFDALPVPQWSIVSMLAALIGTLMLVTTETVGAAWAVGSFVALAIVLAGPLIEIGRHSAVVLEAERQLAAVRGAKAGHSAAHGHASPNRGRLLRAATEAEAAGHLSLAALLRQLAERCRQAELRAGADGESRSVSSARADQLGRMVREVKGRPSRLFSDPENMPVRWGPRRRAVWRPFAERLDAVRAIHTHQLEWIALYATLWLRPLLLLAIPVLPASLTSGIRPFQDSGHPVAEIVWLLALSMSLVVAVASPWLVPRAQRKDVERLPLCDRMFMLEAPVWFALIAAAPSWAAWTFGAGPFTWAERPTWRTRRAIQLAAAGIAALAISLLAHGAAEWQVALECLAAAVTMALLASSYGLLFPLVVDRVLFAGRRRAAAERRLESVLAEDADRVVRGAVAEADAAIRAAGMSGGAARELATAATTERPRRRRLWPQVMTVADVIANAAVPLVPGAIEAGDRISLRDVDYDPPELALTAVKRPYRTQLTRAWKAMIGEADRHGVGEIAVQASLEGEVLRLTISNEPDPDDPPGGSRRGTRIMDDELQELPAGRLVVPPRPAQRRREGLVTEVWITTGECSSIILGRR